jgi:hypothetical protein
MPNYDTDCQISNLWTFKTPKPYKGSLRDEQGNALNGFKVQDSKKTRKVSIVNNGHYMRHYKFPKGLNVPKHPMNRWLNTPMCGLTLEDEEGNLMSFHDGVVNALLAGKKPVGTIMFRKEEKEECELFLKQARVLEFEILEQKKPFEATYKSLMVGVNKPLKELFDLDEIYNFYYDGIGRSKERRHPLIDKVEHLTPVKVLQLYDWSSPETPTEFIVTGLCLGYSFESTLAIILEDFSDEDLDDDL